jgi:hypothetical protein
MRIMDKPHTAETDAAAYDSFPVASGEFSAEDEPLEWEAEGWGDIG